MVSVPTTQYKELATALSFFHNHMLGSTFKVDRNITLPTYINNSYYTICISRLFRTQGKLYYISYSKPQNLRYCTMYIICTYLQGPFTYFIKGKCSIEIFWKYWFFVKLEFFTLDGAVIVMNKIYIFFRFLVNIKSFINNY